MCAGMKPVIPTLNVLLDEPIMIRRRSKMKNWENSLERAMDVNEKDIDWGFKPSDER